jgi:hypothetical protein
VALDASPSLREMLAGVALVIEAIVETHATDISNLAERVSALEDVQDQRTQVELDAHIFGGPVSKTDIGLSHPFKPRFVGEPGFVPQSDAQSKYLADLAETPKEAS